MKAKYAVLDANKLHSLPSVGPENKKEMEQPISNNAAEEKGGIVVVKHSRRRPLYSEQELIQDMYGMEHIQYSFCKGKTIGSSCQRRSRLRDSTSHE